MTAQIHPTAYVEPGATIGKNVEIGPFAYVGPNVTLGDHCVLRAHASVAGYTTLGPNCELHSYAVIGGPPQVIGYKETSESRLEVGKDCVFREHTTAHTGMPTHSGVTRIGDNCFLMVGAHIAHDNTIGNNNVLANNVSLAGHVETGDNVWFGGLAAVHQFTRIGRNAFVGGGAILVEDVIPFGSVVGNHAKLVGLNMVGLKRRGFTKEEQKEIRSAYKSVFFGDGIFRDRLAAASDTYREQPLAMEIISFIQTGGDRPICKPG